MHQAWYKDSLCLGLFKHIQWEGSWKFRIHVFMWCLLWWIFATEWHHTVFACSALLTCSVFSCDQAAIWLVLSVRPSVCLSVRLSVCLSVRHTFFTMFPSSYHLEIFRSYYQWQKWRSCKRSRSKVKVTEVNTQVNCFRTVTPVWIHIWWWSDAYSLMVLRRGALLFLKVIRQISRSHGSKKRFIWPRLGVSGL